MHNFVILCSQNEVILLLTSKIKLYICEKGSDVQPPHLSPWKQSEVNLIIINKKMGITGKEIYFSNLTAQGQMRLLRKNILDTIDKRTDSVTISEAYLSYSNKLIQDVRVANNRGSETIMWDCHSAAFTIDRDPYFFFNFLRKDVQIKIIKDVLHQLLDLDVDIKQVTVSKQYVVDGEAKQEVTATSFDGCWTIIIWNCRKVCFEVAKKEMYA